MKKIIFLIVVVLVGVIGYKALFSTKTDLNENKKVTQVQKTLKKDSSDTKNKNQQSTIAANNTGINTTGTNATTSVDSAIEDFEIPTEIPATDEESLTYYTKMLKHVVAVKANPNRIMEHLTAMKISPRLKTRTNDATGTVQFIRTQNSLKGTKYFHAQFVGEGENTTLEHMSFNIRPGKDSMNNAVALLQKQFDIQNKGTVKFNDPDAKAWALDNGYVVWVKKLAQADLKNDLFNAYSNEDIGSIRIAVEIDQD